MKNKTHLYKKYLVFTISIILLNSFSLKLYADSNKHALIIAIAEYNRAQTGWSPISSDNDVPLIKMALLGQGFEENNISILENTDADKAGIIKAFNDLINTASKGDYIVVHYSGHGQQISDDNNDEIDGLDETLVTINAPTSYKAGENYTGENHLRDEEFGALIDQLRQKVGKNGQVIVILDSCHSGTGTRGSANVRGGEPPLIIPGQASAKEGVEEEGFGMNESTVSSRGSKDNMAPMVLFSGAKSDELNYETKDENGNGVGSLSYAISKALMEVDANSTYLSIFAHILEIMAVVAPHQTPMIEGDINYKLFNGDVVEQEYYYQIDEIIDEKKIRIDGGNVTGVSVGDKIGLYNSGTASIDKETAVISGTVKESNHFNAVIEFEAAHSITNLKSYWAFIEEYNLELEYLGIFLEELDSDLNTKIIADLKDINKLSNIVDKVDDANILITTKKQKDEKNARGSSTIYIKSMQSGYILREIKLNKTKDEISKDVAKTVKEYTQGMFIKSLELEDENYQIEIEFIPVVPVGKDSKGKVKRDEHGNCLIKDTLNIEDFMVNGTLEFDEKDVLMIRIKNTGNSDAYFNIIDIQPDGIINALYPKKTIKPEDCFLKAGKSHIPRDFIINGFYPPFGKENFKVFANADPIDLKPIVTTKGSGTRGLSNSLGALMKNSYQSRGAGGETGSVSNKDTGSTKMYPFVIKKK